MTSTEKIGQIITKMSHLNELWWDSEENHNQAAKQEHDSLEKEIRTDMEEIGIDYDTVGSTYEDMISTLRTLTDYTDREIEGMRAVLSSADFDSGLMSVINNLKHDYLTVNNGRDGAEYIWYMDEGNNIILKLDTMSVVVDNSNKKDKEGWIRENFC
jgi:hypothetical protein